MVLKKASDQGNASFKNHMYRARCQPKGVSSLRNVHFFYDKKKLAVCCLASKATVVLFLVFGLVTECLLYETSWSKSNYQRKI